jgi:hypothetical protein
MIIIEGARNVGKTYLLEQYLKNFPNKYFTYKFPFFDFYKELELDQELNAGTYFGYGKDLDLLTLAKSNLLPANLLLDRGFVSNAVFAMIFRKAKEADMVKYIEIIKEHFSDVPIDIVYVEADEYSRTQNNIAEVREKDASEVDALNVTNSDIYSNTYTFKYNWVLGLLDKCPNIHIHKITNHFNEESVKEFSNLLNSLYK